MSQSDPQPRQNRHPNLDRARHALLFELIRQRSMAQYVSRRNPDQPDTDPADLHVFVQTASRSIAPQERPLL